MSEPLPEIQVFTFKDGLLARLAHDLRLSLTGFEIRIDGSTVEGRMWPESLRVDGVMRGANLRVDELSASDRAKIQRNIREDVMVTARYPEVRFRGEVETTAGGARVTGTLEMLARQQPVTVNVRREGDKLVGVCELQPSKWGIRPYKALAGAIKLQDRVRVALAIPVVEGDKVWQVGLGATAAT